MRFARWIPEEEREVSFCWCNWIFAGCLACALSLYPSGGQARSVLPPRHGITLHPRSAQVKVGKAYPFRLYTHCGANWDVDFDHTFWDLADPHWADRTGGEPHQGLGNPFQPGTMTLVDRRHARFDFTEPMYGPPPMRTQRAHIWFMRHHGPKVLPGFCD